MLGVERCVIPTTKSSLALAGRSGWVVSMASCDGCISLRRFEHCTEVIYLLERGKRSIGTYVCRAHRLNEAIVRLQRSQVFGTGGGARANTLCPGTETH